MLQTMLTTVDNPYNPFTQYDDWMAYDEASGHYTCSLLASITKTSDELSETDEEQAIDDAIDEIVRNNSNGLYRKVTEDVE